MVLQSRVEENKIVLPLVSVVTAIYNGELFIADTISSVLNQTYPNIEIIIVNDASTDGTIDIINNLIAGLSITVITNTKNAGAAASRNIGYAHAKGELIKFLDGDDLINPEAIAEQVKLATHNTGCIISGKHGRFYENDISTFKLDPQDCWQTLPPAEWLYTSWKDARSMTNPGIFLIPRDIIDKAGLWDESLSLLDDFEYFARTILAAKMVYFCDGAILYYRSGITNSLSGVKTRKGYESAYLSIEKATTTLLQHKQDDAAKLACATAWQSFVYETYLLHADLTIKAENHLITLPLPTIKFPGGKLTKAISATIGWKAAKKLQSLKRLF